MMLDNLINQALGNRLILITASVRRGRAEVINWWRWITGDGRHYDPTRTCWSCGRWLGDECRCSLDAVMEGLAAANLLDEQQEIEHAKVRAAIGEMSKSWEEIAQQELRRRQALPVNEEETR